MNTTAFGSLSLSLFFCSSFLFSPSFDMHVCLFVCAHIRSLSLCVQCTLHGNVIHKISICSQTPPIFWAYTRKIYKLKKERNNNRAKEINVSNTQRHEIHNTNADNDDDRAYAVWLPTWFICHIIGSFRIFFACVSHSFGYNTTGLSNNSCAGRNLFSNVWTHKTRSKSVRFSILISLI